MPKKTAKTTKIENPLERLEAILKAIIKYNRPEVTYDEFAYNRLKEAYREAAKQALDCLKE